MTEQRASNARLWLAGRPGDVVSVRSTIAANGVRAAEKRKSGAPPGRVARFLRGLGPGLITGASDDDPSGIGTYSQAGAQLGFGIGWTMLLTYPLMVAIEEII